MQVIVDTSVWLLAMRRSQALTEPVQQQALGALKDLIVDTRALMLGAVRQELLSGIKDRNQWEKLRSVVAAFPDVVLSAADYERAAEFFNICRGQGIQGSNTDFLLCAVAVNRSLPILTVDQDFVHFAACLPLQLYLST